MYVVCTARELAARCRTTWTRFALVGSLGTSAVAKRGAPELGASPFDRAARAPHLGTPPSAGAWGSM